MDHAPPRLDPMLPVRQVMRTGVFTLSPDLTLEEAWLRARPHFLTDTITYFYVVDANGRLSGILPTRAVLAAQAEQRVEQAMVRNLVKIGPEAPLHEAARLLRTHRLLAVPVVDPEGRLLGVIDATLFGPVTPDVYGRIAHDDLFQLIGVHLEPGSRAAILRWVGDRLPWLMGNVVSGLICAMLAARYGELINEILLLALFMPVVLALSESVSIQSMTLTLQQLHLPLPLRQQSLTRLREELPVAGIMAVSCGLITGLAAAVWQGEPGRLFGLHLLLSIAAAMTISALIGVLLPLVIQWRKLNPRIASGPLTLAMADIVTVLVYLELGTRTLRWGAG